MDFVVVIQQCEDATVRDALLGALRTLFERDRKLLELSAKEEAIAFHLARYLQPYFPELHVDFEYDRMGDAPKTVTYDERPQRVFPDIIVHLRHTPTNVLAVELKKDTNGEAKDRDIRKLSAYRRELGYRHALFVRFGTGVAAGAIEECEWVD